MARAARPALLLVFLPALAAADDVVLRNGRVFEGVVAVAAGDSVRIRMPGGELRLPASQVLRVDPGPAPYAEYMARRDELRARPEAGAAEWLALARWAMVQELAQCAREAALVAASLDPALPGLAPVLSGFGYSLEESQGRWIPHDEWMARRGFVHYQGRWMTGAEQEEHLREQRREAAERAMRLAAAREAAWRREEAIAVAERREAAAREIYWAAPVYAVPIAIFPGFVVPAFPRHPGHGEPPDARPERPRDPPPQQNIGSYLLRQPGSLLPGDLDLRGDAGRAPAARRGGSSR